MGEELTTESLIMRYEAMLACTRPEWTNLIEHIKAELEKLKKIQAENE